MHPVTVTLLLGSDIEPRMKYLEKALSLLQEEIGNIKSVSSVYESEPWGFESSSRFLNAVVVLETGDSPAEVLKKCQNIEKRAGRTRNLKKGYSSRTLDVDILFYGDKTVNERDLMIPHPRMHKRRFTLLPLNELLPDFVHPVIGKTTADLLKSCKDNSEVGLFKKRLNAL